MTVPYLREGIVHVVETRLPRERSEAGLVPRTWRLPLHSESVQIRPHAVAAEEIEVAEPIEQDVVQIPVVRRREELVVEELDEDEVTR